MSQTFLITGHSSGIGQHVCQSLLNQGHQIIGLARRLPTYHAAALKSFPVDLADVDHLPDRIAELKSHITALDGAIFCAGQGRFGTLEQFSYAQIRNLVDLNFTANALLTRALLPELKRRGRGLLIFIGSEAALQGKRKGTIYCASKFALRGFCQALREECASSGVRVSLINPGMVQTPFFDNLEFTPGHQPGQFIEPQDVAAAVCHLIDSPAHLVIDELNLSPLSHRVLFKSKT